MDKAVSAFRLIVVPVGWIASALVSGFFLWLGLDLQWHAGSGLEQAQWYAVVAAPWVVLAAAVLIWLRTERRMFPDLLLIAAPAFHLIFFAVGTLLSKL